MRPLVGPRQAPRQRLPEAPPGGAARGRILRAHYIVCTGPLVCKPLVPASMRGVGGGGGGGGVGGGGGGGGMVKTGDEESLHK